MAVNVILGEEHRLISNSTAGFGFVGIAVALMGRAHPVGIDSAAILFGMLYQGGAVAFEKPKISRDMIVVIQGLVVLFAGALEHMFRRSGRDAAQRAARPPRRSEGRGACDLFNAFIVVFASGIRLGTPLILACLAGLWSERSGVVDIGLEGKMLVGAFGSAAVATFTGNVWLGLLAGVAATIAVSLVHGYASIDQRANQIVSGTAINMVAAGLTALIGNAIWSQGGRTPELPASAQFQAIELPFVDAITPVPILGPIYQHLISGHDLVTYAAFLLVPLTYWALYSTPIRLAAACGRREPGRGRHRRHLGARVALRRGGDLRRAGWPVRRLFGVVAGRLLSAEHERRQGLHRASRAGVRQVASVAGARHMPPVRLSRCGGDPPTRR